MQSIQKCGLEDCKVAKDIDIALLRSCRKDWSIEMKNVQISQELFWWMLPITIGLTLSVPISMLTSLESAGRWCRSHTAWRHCTKGK